MRARVYILAATKTREKEHSIQASARIPGALLWLPPTGAVAVSMIVSKRTVFEVFGYVKVKLKEDDIEVKPKSV